jgi:hypothetical protein
MTSVAEQYLRATHSKNLRVSDTHCDADLLLAAAYASAGDERKILALDVWRMRHQGHLRGCEHIVDRYTHRLIKAKRGVKLSDAKARETVWRTLMWWMHMRCDECDGLGHPVIPNTPHLDTSVDCPACNGTGETPLHKVVPEIWGAQWLVHELDALSGIVFADMARTLRPQLDL